ncbi:SRPBCC family protein [Ornithinimicrobium sp. Arc0846-15]|nr:SRPBCC family protein [Ornithinimicrobium laminariae]
MANDTFSLSRSITINAAPQEIYPHIQDLRKWQGWSPWEGMDDNLQREYTGADSGVGQKYAWSGNRKAGAGSMEIVRVDEPSTVGIDLAFTKPFKAQNDTLFELSQHGESTVVTWTMSGKQTLMGKAMNLFGGMEKMVGPDFERGLAQLKTLVDGQKGSR